ncbi:MAG: beta strand repeat-containing protein [Fimbriiglobus sp.]
MASRWLKRTKDGKSLQFMPGMVFLEDRTVPATFFVDPTLVAAGGAAVTFAAGTPREAAGIFATNLADWTTNPTRTTFNNLSDALLAAEQNPGADTIEMAPGVLPVNNAGPNNVGGGVIENSIPVSQELTLRGAGDGATIITPLNNSQADFGAGFVDDEFTAIFRVVGANAKLTAEDFRLDGSGKLIGGGFQVREGAVGNFNGVSISNIVFEPNMVSSGVGIVAAKGGVVNFDNGEVSNYGRVGILYQGAKGMVTNSKITGRGAGMFAQNGIELAGDAVAGQGSVVMVLGNLITGNNGTVAPTDRSSGLIVLDDGAGANPSEAWAIGNTFSGNTVALNVGATAADASTLKAQYNELTGNTFAVFGGLATTTIDATNNYFGDATGPFSTASTAGKGDTISTPSKVNFTPFLTFPTPEVAPTVTAPFAASVANYLDLITQVDVDVEPVGPALLTAPTASVQFNITFAQAVEGFDLSDIVVNKGTPSLVGSGKSYVLTVSGLTGNGDVTASVVNRAAIEPTEGYLSAASNVGTVVVAVPNAGPTITGTFPDQVVVLPSNSVAPIPFTIGDDAGLAGLTVTATASNGTVIPASSIVLGGSGANRTISLVNLPGNLGASTVTVSVSDGTMTANQSFAVAVNAAPVVVPPQNAQPTLTGTIPDQTIAAGGTSGPLAFTVGDDTTPASALTVSVSTSNPSVVPASSVTLGGSGANRTVTVSNLPGTVGSSAITLTVTDASGATITKTFVVNVPAPVVVPPVTPIDRIFAVGADAGSLPLVQVYGANGAARFQFLAFESTFTGGVKVATADVNGDRVEDIVVSAGMGGSARVRIISGKDGTELGNFIAFEPSFRGGANVAAGDLDGDGKAEIILGAGMGRAPQVLVTNAAGVSSQDFLAYAGSFTGGVNVGVGDANADGKLDIITGAGRGGAPHVRAFNGSTVVANYYAFDTKNTQGVYVAGGTFGIAAALGGPSSSEIRFSSGGKISNAYETGFTGGVRLGAFDINGDGTDEVLTAPGAGGGSRVQALSASGASLFNGFAFDNIARTGYFIG